MADYIITGSSQEYLVGVPQNNPAFFDGTRYWVFYIDSSTLKCKYGTSLDSLSSTYTDTSGTGNIASINNNGKALSIVFGTVGTTWYAWAVMNRSDTVSAESFRWQRWELTSTGLDNSISYYPTSSARTSGHVALCKDFGSETVSDMYVSVQVWNGDAPNRGNNTDLTGDTAMGAVNSASILFPEHTLNVELSDGFVAIAIDEGSTGEINGNYGHLREWRKTNIDDSWGAEQTIEGNVTGASTADGDFTDQNYAANTSHAGQQDFCQLDDGNIYIAYCGNDDLTNGDYGEIKLVHRGNTQTSGWTLKSSDVIGASTAAHDIALATDGTDVWVLYVKEDSGKDTAIHYKKYNVSAGTFGDEVKLTDMQDSYSLVRMATQYRFTDDTLLVAWTEFNTTYDMGVAAIDTSVAVVAPIPSLIYTPSSRGLGKQKPQQWGPFSAVQASLFKNAERIGIDPAALHTMYPLWEGAGKINNYAPGPWAGVMGGTWSGEGLVFDGTDITRDADAKSGPLNEVTNTIFAVFKTPSTGTARPFNVGSGIDDEYFAIDANVGVDFSYWFRDGGTQNITHTALTPEPNTWYTVYCVAVTANRHNLYINGALVATSTTFYTETATDYADVGIGGLYRDTEIPSECVVAQCGSINQALNAEQIALLSDNLYLLWQPAPQTFIFDLAPASTEETVVPFIYSPPKLNTGKQKPQQWGPASAVQSALFKNAERIGIDPESIEFAMPMWNPGDQIDYSKNALVGTNSGVDYQNNSLDFGSTTSSDRIALSPNDVGRMVFDEGTLFFRVNLRTISNSTYPTFWSVRDASTTVSSFMARKDTGGDYALTFAVGGDSIISPDNYAVPAELRTYAVTWDGSTVVIYSISSNGVAKIYSEANTGTPQTSSITPVIGNRSTGARCLNGVIESCTAFSTALRSDQIMLLADSPNILWQPAPQTFIFDVGATTPTGQTLQAIAGSEFDLGSYANLSQPNLVYALVGAEADSGYTPVLTQSASADLQAIGGAETDTGHTATYSQPNALTAVIGAETEAGYVPILSQTVSTTYQALAGAETELGYTPILTQTASGNYQAIAGAEADSGHISTLSQPNSLIALDGAEVETGYVANVAQLIVTNLQAISGSEIDSGYVAIYSQPNLLTALFGNEYDVGHIPVLIQSADATLQALVGNESDTGYLASYYTGIVLQAVSGNVFDEGYVATSSQPNLLTAILGNEYDTGYIATQVVGVQASDYVEIFDAVSSVTRTFDAKSIVTRTFDAKSLLR